MPRLNVPPGVMPIKAKLRDGTSCYYFYLRGVKGSRFWKDKKKEPTDPAFFAAYSEMVEAASPKARQNMTPAMVDGYLSSPIFAMKKPRTQADYRKWALRFADAFRDDPAALFEEPASRREVNEWRAAWKHSPKQYDYAGTVATVILNWAVDEGEVIGQHHCHRLPKVYEVDRSGIVWTPSDREAFDAVTPGWVRRILTAACETGLRPGDLIKLTWKHIEPTPKGRRVRVRTNKRGRQATIPVTPAMGKLLDATPRSRMLILTSASGRPLTEHRASEGVRQWRDKADLSTDLRLQDARGTAATRLLTPALPWRRSPATWAGASATPRT